MFSLRVSRVKGAILLGLGPSERVKEEEEKKID